MSKITALLFAIFFINLTYSQCLDTIPSNALRGSADLGGSGSRTRWLCDGDTVTSGGGGSHTLYLESGSYAHLTGGGGQVFYAKSGATVKMTNGGATVYYESGAIIIDSSFSGIDSNFCSTLTFNYDHFGSNLCEPTTGIANSLNIKVKTYPNPFVDVFNVSVQGIEKNTKFQLVDIQGRVVSSGVITSVTKTIDGSLLEKGIYTLKIDSQPSVKLYKL